HQVLGELHFYGLHGFDERQLFKGFTLLWSSSNKKPEFFEKNSGFCALGIIIPSLRKYGYFRRLAILSSAIWIICLTISPPTFPLSRAVVSAPSSPLNSFAISVFNWSTAFSDLGTKKSFRFLSAGGIVDHSLWVEQLFAVHLYLMKKRKD